MRANCWYGKHDVRVKTVPDPKILNPGDAIVKVTSTAICGSDLHLYDGVIPTMEKGDILGHEFMGEVVEVGPNVKKLKIGDRVVVPFPISCGRCFFCERKMYSLCENSNPNALLAEELWGHSPSGIYGYSHLLGGYAGGQAEYVRVPFADFNPFKIESDLADDKVLFLSDILPTGYMAAEACDIRSDDTVAVWGAGPVGQFAMLSANLLGASRVVAIDSSEGRLGLARDELGVETINYEEVDVQEALNEMTGGRGPDACIDAVGLEAQAHGLFGAYDKVKQKAMLETDRPTVLREAIMCCRNGGIVSVPGVYGGFADKIPVGSIMNRSLTIKTGQTHVHRYVQPLLERIERGDFDPSFVITHHMSLEDAPKGYEMFREKKDECVKVVLRAAA